MMAHEGKADLDYKLVCVKDGSGILFWERSEQKRYSAQPDATWRQEKLGHAQKKIRLLSQTDFVLTKFKYLTIECSY